MISRELYNNYPPGTLIRYSVTDPLTGEVIARTSTNFYRSAVLYGDKAYRRLALSAKAAITDISNNPVSVHLTATPILKTLNTTAPKSYTRGAFIIRKTAPSVWVVTHYGSSAKMGSFPLLKQATAFIDSLHSMQHIDWWAMRVYPGALSTVTQANIENHAYKAKH